MTRAPIDIEILDIFNLSMGKMYSIKFPRSVLPFSGFKFLFNECTWEVKGIAINKTRYDENVWDCIICPVGDCSKDIPQGRCIIEAIDLKQRFIN